MQNKFNFDVYFEIYGKKMKAIVLAENEQEAQVAVRQKLTIHKVQKSKGDAFNECIDMMNDILGGLPKK
jgi:hypothetical protein